MSDLPLEALLANPRVRVVETPPPVVDVPSHAEAVSPPVPSPTREHAAAVDAAFLHEKREQETIAGLIGLRLSVLLMHDLARESMQEGEEEQPREKPRFDGPEPQPACD